LKIAFLQEIEQLKKEVAVQCVKLEGDINNVEELVKKNKELKQKNKELLQRDAELNKHMCELEDNLNTKDKVCLYVQSRLLRWCR
jgi:predicted transcriptional regulator